MTTTVAYLDESASSWDRTLYAFLAEKHRRSGSRRTVDAYSRMLNDFFGRAGKTPDQVTSADAFAWAYGHGLSGKEPSSVTIAARLACLSSYFRFLIRMKVLASNPCDAIERPRITPGMPRGLTGDDIRRLLAVLPDTPVGLRDRAIILMLTFTGRRRTEVMSLTVGDLAFEGSSCYYTYRGKGGKTGRRELPQPVVDALRAWLAASGRDLGAMDAGASLWPSLADGRGITSGTFYANLRALPEEGGAAAGGRAHLPPQRREAPARRRRVHRGREPVPGPQQPGGDDDVPAAAGGAGGPELGEGGGGDRGLASCRRSVGSYNL